VTADVVAPAIDQLTEADLEEVLEIESEQFDDPWSLGILRDEIANPTRRYTKATLDGALAGYLGLMVVETEAHVNTLATSHAAERRGVATALLVEGIGAMIGRGVHDVTLEVAARNTRAQRLYARFGFAPVGIRKGYYPKSGDDAVVMWVRDVHAETYVARLAAIAGS
jgi:[ribosomal protein S18]-alanine N-acetyltransferase